MSNWRQNWDMAPRIRKILNECYFRKLEFNIKYLRYRTNLPSGVIFKLLQTIETEFLTRTTSNKKSRMRWVVKKWIPVLSKEELHKLSSIEYKKRNIIQSRPFKRTNAPVTFFLPINVEPDPENLVEKILQGVFH